jgi:Ca2+/Na+ antiporter
VPNPIMNRLTPLTKTTWAAVRRHPVLASVLAVLCLVFAGLSFLVGFIQMVVLLIPVAIFVLYMLHRRTKKGADDGPAETIAVLSYIAIGAVLTFVLIQAVPYGRNHNTYDPSTAGEMKWDTSRTRELTVNACYGCHSNQVEYPSYASVAPISWAVQSHIDEGRQKLNFSTFTSQSEGFDEVLEVIDDGSMPPGYYTAFGRHPEARLSDAEMVELVRGLHATLTANGVNSESGGNKKD